ncbi:MAG: PVC-type heme-binding CxxCH protein [Balneolales bacterium]
MITLRVCLLWACLALASESYGFDREYVLESTMLGYTGVGGNIDGIRNPVLRAGRGEVVKITIINGELMPHDIAMEKSGVISATILEAGQTTSIVFDAVENDTYYCTIPGHRESGMEGRFEVTDGPVDEEVAAGVIPQRQGRPLNLDLESGMLGDWTADGEAFAGQVVHPDPSPVHEQDMTPGHRGEYFLSSGGTKNYQATGTLTSVPFAVNRPYGSFMVSGGALKETRVELVRDDTGQVIFEITGNNHATLRPVVVDLQPHLGEDIFIRIVDMEDGASGLSYIQDNIWAHINFDHFEFHTSRPDFANELRREDIVILPPRDIIPYAGLSGRDAARNMTLPEGFSVALAAAEPDVVRPIGFALDHRGRLWVAEGHTYPDRAPEGEGEDRILIFEDTNGDGTLDKRIVFTDGLNLVSGIEVGFGGVWVGAAPYLMYIPVDETGDAPAGEPEVLLDGWGHQDTHETLNSLTWGPDGWLYGAHGVFTHSNVGKPGAGERQRQKINAGIWRYHPTRHEFEVFAEGTSNPWGIAFNDYGHAFTTVCVIPHLFHVVQGARYHRQSGEHFNPHVYDDIATIADHVHYVGDRGPHAGNFRSAAQGGGHAHAGAMFYLGNEHWGMDRDAIFMNNIHGYRVNTDLIKRQGSGYTASHGEDFLLTNDSWSQWLNFRHDPGGSVFAIDWYDKNQCHSRNPDVHDKSLGRIFRISHEKDQWVQVDLSARSSGELVQLQLHGNDWYVKQARKILQARGPDREVHRQLKQILAGHPEVPRKLRALWALHVTGGISVSELQELLQHENEYLRGWAVRLLTEKDGLSAATLGIFADMARTDTSALVRLHLASVLQQIKPESRWAILEGLYGWPEDGDDHNLPLMVWYGAEPMAGVDMDRALKMAMTAKLPVILPYTIRRIKTMDSPKALQALRQHIDQAQTHEQHYIIQAAIDELHHSSH